MPTQPNLMGRNAVGGFGTQGAADYPEMYGARTEMVVWKGTTTNASATEIFVNGDSTNSARFKIDSTTNLIGQLGWNAAAYDATTPATSNVWFGQAGFTSIAGTVAIVANSTNTKMPTAGTLTLALTADNTNKAAVFTATGIAAETIYWVVNGWWTVITALGWRQ